MDAKCKEVLNTMENLTQRNFGKDVELGIALRTCFENVQKHLCRYGRITVVKSSFPNNFFQVSEITVGWEGTKHEDFFGVWYALENISRPKTKFFVQKQTDASGAKSTESRVFVSEAFVPHRTY